MVLTKASIASHHEKKKDNNKFRLGRRAATPTLSAFTSPCRHQIPAQHNCGPPSCSLATWWRKGDAKAEIVIVSTVLQTERWILTFLLTLGIHPPLQNGAIHILLFDAVPASLYSVRVSDNLWKSEIVRIVNLRQSRRVWSKVRYFPKKPITNSAMSTVVGGGWVRGGVFGGGWSVGFNGWGEGNEPLSWIQRFPGGTRRTQKHSRALESVLAKRQAVWFSGPKIGQTKRC